MNNEYFSILRLLYSIGKQISEHYKYPIYINPMLQGAQPPCFFIQCLNMNDTHIEKEIGNNIFRYQLKIAIIYVEKQNDLTLYEKYYNIIDKLDYNLKSIKLYDDEGNVYASLRTNFRQFETSLENLIYKFEVAVRVVAIEPPSEKLKNLIIDLTIGGNNGEQQQKQYLTIRIPNKSKK